MGMWHEDRWGIKVVEGRSLANATNLLKVIETSTE